MKICEVISNVYHANNVAYLNTNVTIIIRKALEIGH